MNEKMFSGKVEFAQEHDHPLIAEEILEVTMKKYLFNIDILQVSGENSTFSNRYISHEVETAKDAWREVIKDLNIDLLDLTNVNSISVRLLGKLDE